MGELKSVLPFVRPYARLYGAGMILVGLSNLFMTLGPRFLQRGIDALERGAQYGQIREAAVLLIAVALLGGVARFGMRELLNSGSRRVEYRMRNALFQHLTMLPAAFYDRSSTGDVMARTTNDLLAVRMVVGPAVMYLADTIVRTVFIAPAMVAISLPLTLIALLPLTALPVAMTVLGRRIHERTTQVQDQFSTLTEVVHENLSGVRVVKAYRQEAVETAGFLRESRTYVDRNLGLARIQGTFHPLLSLLGGLGSVAVLYAGGRLVMAGTVTIGAFVAFGVYLAMLIWPMIALGWVVNLFQRGAASLARINDLFRQQPTITSPPPADRVTLPPARGGRRVAAEGVWFRYPGAPERGWVLRDVSFSIAPGGALAIVGPTGAGKSTLVELLTRTYDPDRGRLLLDGVDLRRLDVGDLRRAVGFVPQETFLFSQTIRENLLLGAPDDGRLVPILEAAQLSDTIAGFPDGLDTWLGERGINLSGGQKQRTAIARALAQDPPVFVLDDALSAVDANTEARILQALREALRGRTSIVVTHRLAAVRDADHVIVIDGGAVVEEGTPSELVARRGRFWELLRRQQLEEELDRPTATSSTPPA